MFQSGKWILRIVLVAGVVAMMTDSASAQLFRRNRARNGGNYGAPSYNSGNYYGGSYIPGPSYGLPGDYGTNSQSAGPAVTYQSNYYTSYGNDSATIDVRVPKYAKVWFDDEPTQQTGELRFFFTPRLAVDKIYHYTIKVKWVEDGKPLETTRTIEVRPGAMLVVDFLRPQPMSDNPQLIKP